MSINTEWLWTPHDYKVDGHKFNKGDMSARSYAKEINFYANLVKKHDVDILALSEIENQLVAKDLARAIGADWQVYFKQGRDTATGQDVAIVSRLEYVASSMTDFGFPSGQIPTIKGKNKRLSKVLGVQFWRSKPKVSDKIGVITAHFLSKRKGGKKKSQNRHRQAYALVKAMDMFKKEVDALLVLGDFNDYSHSETLSILQYKHRLISTSVLGEKINKWTLDHILYSGLTALSYRSYDLKKHSDHNAIMADFY